MTAAPLHFVELKSDDPSVYKLECPQCGVSHARDREVLVPGLHHIVCKNFEFCTFGSDQIKLRDGALVSKSNRDHA